MVRKIEKGAKGVTVGSGIPEGMEAPYALKNALLKAWQTPSDRSKVARVGPSGIGQPCSFCLATEMAWSLPGGQRVAGATSYPSLRGTLVHDGLEHMVPNMIPGWKSESKLYCGEVEGYGEIKGSADGLALHHNTIVDWKALGRTSYEKILRKGLGQQYDVQRHTYAYGANLLDDVEVEFVMIVVLPMHKSSYTDIIWEIQRVDDTVREAAYERAATIWEKYVLTDRIGALASKPEECFNCSGVAEYM